jgi:hypothetical protein
MINHFNPMIGNKNAPERLLETRAKLLILQRNAKEVASKPGVLFRAIKSMTIKNINIPIKLYNTL